MSLLILCGSRANSWPFYGVHWNSFTASRGQSFSSCTINNGTGLYTWAMFKLNGIDFRVDTESYAVWCEHLSDMWLFTLKIGVTQLRFVSETVPKSPFSCVNRSTIRYGFRAVTRAIRYRAWFLGNAKTNKTSALICGIMHYLQNLFCTERKCTS